jgi:molybdenum cofactor sulfurtransferase
MTKSLLRSKKGNQESSKLSHDEFFNKLRQKEYDRLDKDKHVYLDYTGGNLYSKSQLEKHFKMLNEYTFGNPHSTNPTSKISTELVEETRESVLKFFNAPDYYCIFTQNASMALQIVGESYPFEKNGHFLHCVDNHNSVIGIREYCIRNGGSHEFFPIDFDDLSISYAPLIEKLTKSKKDNKLFAYPAQSNVSGVKHDLNYIKVAQDLGWDVLLDAAAFVPTSVLDLSKHKPDYVSVSFYKIFGFPTGIGCLLVKKTSFEKLQKKWFAGGTVKLASAQTPFFYLTDNHERFENGTINYLGIPAVKIGLEYIQDIGMGRINERVDSLMKYLHDSVKSLKHSNGTRQLNIYGPDNRENCGGTIIMNFHNPDGSKIWFEKIEEITNSKKISVRTGCFCNPGLDEINHHLTTDELSNCYAEANKDTITALRDSLEKMRGAIRVSVGLATNQKDLDTFISFVKELKDKTIANIEAQNVE